MHTSDFQYHLPPHLIAQTPLEPRDASRLLVLRRNAEGMEHRAFAELPELLQPGDVLVLNDSRVLPARILARREGTGGKAEFLLLTRLGPGRWRALGKPGRRLKPGARFRTDGGAGRTLTVEVLGTPEDGLWTVEISPEEALEAAGQVPLPPYIKTPLGDPERYQTVYSREPGSVAAPTAGLHFTPRLLDDLASRGIRLVWVTLHVGLDTFRPVHDGDPREHRLHGEYYQLSQEAATEINAARREKRRVIAVGTTSVRLLEQVALRSEMAGSQELVAMSDWAELLILPGHRFRVVDGLITNFHLPRTTLLMLVCAFAGKDKVLAAYREAIDRGYRFYSFGDAMLIL